MSSGQECYYYSFGLCDLYGDDCEDHPSCNGFDEEENDDNPYDYSQNEVY